MRIIIVGGGILGATLACQLHAEGAEVVVISAEPGASVASFGWVNASNFLSDAHFRLRAEGIAAWKRMDLDAGLTWQGCLSWENTGAAFDRQEAQLRTLGYPVERLDRAELARREPNLNLPDHALYFESEGIAEPLQTLRELFAKSPGVKKLLNIRVLDILTQGERVVGVSTEQGDIPADAVVVAAGTGSPKLLEKLGIGLKLLDRPGLMLRTRPMPPLMTHIVAAPRIELRQDLAGRLCIPTVAQHQNADAAEEGTLATILSSTLKRAEALLPGHNLIWDEVIRAERPVPHDKAPVFGAIGPDGLFVSVMHSGVTLAAIAGELLTRQILGHTITAAQRDLAEPFSPLRLLRAG